MNIDGVEYVKKEAQPVLFIRDPCNVLAIVDVKEENGHYVTSNGWSYPIKNQCSLIVDLEASDVIRCYHDKEKWATITKEYYDKAVSILNRWDGSRAHVFVREKNGPVLICCDAGLGFVLAPRIEMEDEEAPSS